jgi:phosphate starvation-inducible protein PhoH and related proteins
VSDVVVSFDDNDALREVAGELGSHLRLIGKSLGVDVSQRGSTVRVNGDGPAQVHATRVLEQLYTLVQGGHALHPSDVRHVLRVMNRDPEANLVSLFDDLVFLGLGGRPIAPRTLGQQAYVHALRHSDIVFAVGPAGTGKTYLAMAMAVAALERGEVRRLVLTRPAVEAGEKLGFLPGDLTEKVDPYLRPLYDAIGTMLPPDRIRRMLDRGIVEVAPLAFMRGRTLDEAYVVLDEAQNTTVAQMRMFLTRMGEQAKMVITGDVTQVDLPRGRRSGMAHALEVLKAVDKIAVIEFSSADVVRHPLVAEIIDAYERDDRRHRSETE